MSPRRYTLLSDGSSDRILLRVIDWLLDVNTPMLFRGEWADLGRLPQPPRTLADRIRRALDLYPCDLLFVHRDAENQPRQVRVTEVQSALADLGEPPPAVLVVPVRMTEAWFLFDAGAIRVASGNPHSAARLDLPALQDVERLSDPKAVLHHLLEQASGRSGRKLRTFRGDVAVHRLAECIDDFASLRVLPAFAAFEKDVLDILPAL